VHGDLETVDAKVDVIDANVDDIMATIDQKWSGEPVALLRGHGCNGIDDNSNSLVDDGTEDQIGPDVSVDAAVTLVWFADSAAASAAVADATRFGDDCSPRDAIAQMASSSASPCGLTVTSTGVDECGNTSSDSIVVRVDPDPPTVECSVGVASLWPPDHSMIDVGFGPRHRSGHERRVSPAPTP